MLFILEGLSHRDLTLKETKPKQHWESYLNLDGDEDSHKLLLFS